MLYRSCNIGFNRMTFCSKFFLNDAVGVPLYLLPLDSYAGRRPFCFNRCRLDLSFRRLIFDVAWQIVTKVATCSTMIQIFKIRSEIWMAPSPKMWRSKNIKFRRDFTQLRDLIANISGKQQDIVNRKTALQTTDTPAQANLIP